MTLLSEGHHGKPFYEQDILFRMDFAKRRLSSFIAEHACDSWIDKGPPPPRGGLCIIMFRIVKVQHP